jgi:hypothetical protein
MARIAELNDAVWRAWLDERPAAIKTMAQRHPPDRLYRMRSTGCRVTLHSYSEDGTVTVFVGGQFNLVVFERRVFGVSPDDLEECDLPDETERLGALFA